MPKNKKRVVITGLGIVTALGNDLKTYYESLMAGRSGIKLWQNIKEDHCISKVGGDLSDFDLLGYLKHHPLNLPQMLQDPIKKVLPSRSLSVNLTAAACLQACHDADFFSTGYFSKKTHILAGHNIANQFEYVTSFDHFHQRAFDSGSVLQLKDDGILALINYVLQWDGTSFSVTGACASSNMALFYALDLIRRGQVKSVLVSGASNDLSPIVLDAWAMFGAISTKSFNDCPSDASRPFDARREGFVPSHGAAAVVLEDFTFAKKRGAQIYGELLGASSCMNASRLPKPYLNGLVQSMTEALQDAGVAPDQVDYINAHATSTPLGDELEVAAIKEVFGKHSYKIPVNSTKSMLGHCLTAAGATELVATVLQLNHHAVHPTINQNEKDPALDLNFVPNEAISHKMNLALSNNFGFGGYNSSIIIGKL